MSVFLGRFSRKGISVFKDLETYISSKNKVLPYTIHIYKLKLTDAPILLREDDENHIHIQPLGDLNKQDYEEATCNLQWDNKRKYKVESDIDGNLSIRILG